MTTPDNLTTSRNRPQEDGPLAAAMAGRLWRVEAVWPGKQDWSVRLIVADANAVSYRGDLSFFDRGPSRTSPRRPLESFAAGQWRSCEPVR